MQSTLIAPIHFQNSETQCAKPSVLSSF